MDRGEFLRRVTAFSSFGILATCEQVVAVDNPRQGEQPGTPADLIEADEVLLGHYPGGFTIPEGETWQPAGPVTTDGSVIVRGTLKMRSGSSLQFVDVNESTFLGADQGGGPDTDIGVWVMGSGVLDLVGTQRRSWKRGSTRDPSWRPDDRLLIGPVQPGDIGYREGAPSQWSVFDWTEARVGDSVPSPIQMPDGSQIEAPVVNLSQDVWIGGVYPHGRAHIISVSDQAHRIRNVQIRDMGPQKLISSSRGPARVGHLGRYPLHFHIMRDASRGMVVQDVVVWRGGNHAFVTHTSHGVTHRRCAAIDTTADAFWWDHGEETDDIHWDDCLAGGVRIHDPVDGLRIDGGGRGSGNDHQEASGFNLGAGSGGQATSCRACGVTSLTRGAGFHWSGPGANHVWRFQENEAHNNLKNGWRVWFSRNEVFQTIDFSGNKVANCGDQALNLGYQGAAVLVRGVVTSGNRAGVMLRGGPSVRSDTVSPRADGYRYVVEQHHSADDDFGIGIDPDNRAEYPMLVKDSRFDRTRRARFAVVIAGKFPRLIDLVNCTFDGDDLEPEDVRFPDNGTMMAEGSRLRVQRRNGTAWEMDLHSGSPRAIPSFYPG